MRALSVVCAAVLAFATCTSANAGFVSSGSVTVGNNTFVYGVKDLGGSFGHYFQLNDPSPPRIAGGTTSFGVLTPGAISNEAALSGWVIDLGSNDLVAGGTNSRGVLNTSMLPAQISLDFPFGSVSLPSKIIYFESDANSSFTGFITQFGNTETFTVAVPVPAGFALALVGAPCIGMLRRLRRRA